MHKKTVLIFFVTIFAAAGIALFSRQKEAEDARFITYKVNPAGQNVKLYWKTETGEIIGSLGNLQHWLAKRNEQLLFAMNAGMYKPDQSPQGLFIEVGNELAGLDTSGGSGNFYLQQNGVFFITKDKTAQIIETSKFQNKGNIWYATQSGPMLVVDGKLHPAFKKGSYNLNIRNGVGILPGNTLVFAMSKQPVNFYDFASYFQQMGCTNALYLDGLVSRTFLPAKAWEQTDGNFGVIIGVTPP